MYQRNRNWFSFLAVLVTAGLITGIGGIFFVLVDHLGNGPQLVSNGATSPSLPPPESAFDVMGTHDASVLSVSAAKSVPLVASGGYDNLAQLWDRNSRLAIPLPHDGRVQSLTFSEENDLLITGSDSGSLSAWFTPSGQLSDTVQTESGAITGVAVNARGKIVAASSAQGGLTLWTITAGRNLQRLATLQTAGAAINAIAFHPIDENIVVSGEQDGLIQVWDVTQSEPVLTLSEGVADVVSVAVSNNGQYVASGSDDQRIRVWELATGKLLKTLSGHEFLVSAVAFSPDGMLLVSSSYDEYLKVWEWQRGSALCTLEGHSGFVHSVDFTDSGNTLVSGGYDGTIRTWDLLAPENQDCLPL